MVDCLISYDMSDDLLQFFMIENHWWLQNKNFQTKKVDLSFTNQF